MTKTGVVRSEPGVSRLSRWEEKERRRSAGWKGMMSGGAGGREDGDEGEVRVMKGSGEGESKGDWEREKRASDVMK
jgi:hypothetical protein